MTSIEESRFHIIVFSKNYASSSWCLDELVKIMECQETKDQRAYPIFYDVEPTEVRNQSGAVRKAFSKHEKKEGVGRWRDALKQAAGLAGWELKNIVDGHEAKFIQKIVVDISLKLRFINLSIDRKLVGMETRIKTVVSSLEIDYDDVRMIGIKGIGGGGKTTFGKSFVENVKVSKGTSGLKKLQKQVLQDVLNDQSIVVTSVSEGKNMMGKMLCGLKVLLVLDDVDDISQLEALAGEPNWFKQGSRIIITTRDEQVLIAQRVNFIHGVNLLSSKEAIVLLSRYAFAREIPIEGYEALSRRVVEYAAGLPITIKVLGSHLCGRSEREWEDSLERLKKIPEEQTLKRLELTYNGLESDQKKIFLIVVCILKYCTKEFAIRMLESCGFNAQIGLSVLDKKSLITISKYGLLLFHDHIEEMGKNIIRYLHPNEPSSHSRLWINKEMEGILVSESVIGEKPCIKLMFSDLHRKIIITKMRELSILYVHSGSKEREIYEVSQYHSDTLQYLSWYGYPFRSLFKRFRSNKLANIRMCCSNISQLRKVRETKVLDKLVCLELHSSKLRTFDLGMTPHLETLDLKGSLDFKELHMLNEYPKLRVLNLSGSKVSKLNLGMTPYLRELDLEKCYYLHEIHAQVGCLKNIVYLNLSGCPRFDYFLIDKRGVFPRFDTLSKLELMSSSSYICPLHPNGNLPNLGFICNYDEPLPSSSGNLERLLSFGVCACTDLESFSASICDLRNLRELSLQGSIPVVPKDLYLLETLEKLTLSMKEIKHLPYSICTVKHLKYLCLTSCFLLKKLPKDLGRLEYLEELHVTNCSSLRDIPNSVCKMKNLTCLNLSSCSLVEKLPEELGRLKCLEKLYIDDTGISCLPQSIYQLKGLHIIGSREQLESYGFTEITTRYTVWYCMIA